MATPGCDDTFRRLNLPWLLGVEIGVYGVLIDVDDDFSEDA